MSFVVKFGKEKCDVFVGRPSKYGNPYHIGIHGSREEVLELYELHLQNNHHLIKSICRELPGKILGCSCEGFPCHGEILARIANCWQLCLPLILELR